MYCILLGDVDDLSIVEWLQENIAELDHTIIPRRNDHYSNYPKFSGRDDLWIVEVVDTTDTSPQFDTITEIKFKYQDDALLFNLTWGGTFHQNA